MGFRHRHAVFFFSPAAEVNHLAAFGAERLPGVVFPICFSTALRASPNFSVTHQSTENFRDRTSGVRNVNDTEFCGKVERGFAARPYFGNRRNVHECAQASPPIHRLKIPTGPAARSTYGSHCCATHQAPSLVKSGTDACGKR